MSEIKFISGDEKLRKSSNDHSYFQKDWDIIGRRVDTCIKNLSSEVCNNIKNHIFKTFEKMTNSTGLSSGLITTALMQTSVNIPDHMRMFHDLRREICSMGGHVAIIEPGSNVSSAKSLFTLIVQKFLSEDEIFNERTSAEEFLKNLPTSLKSSLAAISAWYYMDFEVDISRHLQDLTLNSPIKNPKTPKEKILNKGPLVVIIPAIEKVPSHVLQKLVQVTSLYVQKQQNQRHLPIFFVFGLSSTEELALDCQFDAQTLACLAIQRFKLPPPAIFVKSLFDELFQIPGFRASRQVVRYLVQQVHNCMDFSVANLLNHYKLAMHKHYLNRRHPKFLAPMESVEKYLDSMTEEGLINILSEYPSFVHFKEDQENKWATSALANSAVHDVEDDSPRNKLLNMLSVHWLLQFILPFILRWIFVLFKDLLEYSENDYLLELYCDWMAGKLLNKDHIQRFNALDPKHVLPAIEVSIGSLTAALNALKSNELTDPRWSRYQSAAVSLISELHNAVNDWLHRLNAASSAPEPEPTPKVNQPTPELHKRMTLKELREKLLKPRHSDRENSAKGPKTWTSVVSEFTNWLCMIVSPRGDNSNSILPSPLTLPMHEVFYSASDARSIAEFKRNVDPHLGGTINRALAYLDEFVVERHWSKETVLGLKGRHPDICTVYQLLRESGSMLSLYDLLISFSSIIEPTSDYISQTTQARFLRAMSELELLGFSRYTERRSDHAMKNPLLELVANLSV